MTPLWHLPSNNDILLYKVYSTLHSTYKHKPAKFSINNFLYQLQLNQYDLYHLGIYHLLLLFNSLSLHPAVPLVLHHRWHPIGPTLSSTFRNNTEYYIVLHTSSLIYLIDRDHRTLTPLQDPLQASAWLPAKLMKRIVELSC